jgi:hypothetical protein
VPEVSVEVLNLVHLDLHYDLTIMKLQRGDFSLVDKHPIEQGLNCQAYVLLVDLERALGVSWVILIHIENRYRDLNRIQGVLLHYLREPRHHLIVLGYHQAVSLELGQPDLRLGDELQRLSF